MHGLINRSIQCFLRDTYGAPVWATIVREAGLGFDSFETMLTYDAALTDAVLEAAARVLGKPRDYVLEDLGTYLVTHENTQAVRRLLRFGGVSFADFLHSLEDLPGRARLALPDIELPLTGSSLPSDARSSCAACPGSSTETGVGASLRNEPGSDPTNVAAEVSRRNPAARSMTARAAAPPAAPGAAAPATPAALDDLPFSGSGSRSSPLQAATPRTSGAADAASPGSHRSPESTTNGFPAPTHTLRFMAILPRTARWHGIGHGRPGQPSIGGPQRSGLRELLEEGIVHQGFVMRNEVADIAAGVGDRRGFCP
ncbi:MAG: heme NO-binding domain-containing protein [Gemmobacter sp.]|nr:heme NO-binding domain-containing protein [Gemmobacter sp.]